MKQRVDEHDITKKMLSTLNEFKNTPSLNMDINEGAEPLPNQNNNMRVAGDDYEEEEVSPLSVVNDSGDEGNDTIEPNQEEMNAEYSKFSDVVNPRVEFTTFKIYPKANNVILGGTFQGMSGLEWQFSLEDENGLYITVNNLQMDDSVMQTLQKLKGYYDNWADEWSKKLATEYKNNSNY